MPLQFNPFTGNLDFAGGDAVAVALNLRGTVANQAALPSSGNVIGHVWQAIDTRVFYAWDGSAWDNLGTLAGPAGPAGPGTDLSYTAATRLLESSSGGDVTLPLFASGAAGLTPASGGGTGNFLRADGNWAAPPAGGGSTPTDLSYNPATRLLESSTGNDVTLPLVASGAAGLAPASGGGTSNFLRADGTWAAPAGGGGGGLPGQEYAAGFWLSPLNGTVGSAAAMVANTIYLYPFTLERSVTVGELGARVNTAAAGTSVQLAIYGTTNGEPIGAPLGNTVSLSAGTQGLVSDNVADFNLTGHVTYWMASNSDGTPALQHLSGAAVNAAAAILGAPTLAQVASAASASGGWRSVAQTFGTWPTLAAGATTVQTGAVRGGIVYLQLAALL